MGGVLLCKHLFTETSAALCIAATKLLASNNDNLPAVTSAYPRWPLSTKFTLREHSQSTKSLVCKIN